MTDRPRSPRTRSETIGNLGRVPARTHRPSAPPPSGPPSRDDPGASSKDRRDGREGRGAVWRWIHGALFENLGLKFLSMVLAVTVFLLVNTDKDREITVRIGLDYAHPPDKVVVGQPIDEARVTIRGTSRNLRRFDERTVERIIVDMTRNAAGQAELTPDMIDNLPPGLEVTSISPRVVRVAYDNRVEKLVEIVPALAGRPQHGYIVSEVKVMPATAKVRGGETQLAALPSVRTTEVQLADKTVDFETEAMLVPPLGISLDLPKVTVQVRIDEELVTRKQTYPIALSVDEAARWKVHPPQVEVTFTGALLAIEKAKDVVAKVKLAATEAGQVVLEGVPPGVGVRISPERVRVTPLK